MCRSNDYLEAAMDERKGPESHNRAEMTVCWPGFVPLLSVDNGWREAHTECRQYSAIVGKPAVFCR